MPSSAVKGFGQSPPPPPPAKVSSAPPPSRITSRYLDSLFAPNPVEPVRDSSDSRRRFPPDRRGHPSIAYPKAVRAFLSPLNKPIHPKSLTRVMGFCGFSPQTRRLNTWALTRVCCAALVN